MRGLDGHDPHAELSASMRALGAPRLIEPEVRIPDKGVYRGAQQQYLFMAKNTAYVIAAYGMQALAVARYWYDPWLGEALEQLFGLSSDRAPETLLPLAGDYLEERGYPRDITAKTLCLYHCYFATGDDDYATQQRTKLTALEMMACADLVMLPHDLSFEQHLDAASRHIPAATLDKLLTGGAPYTLIRDMFPRKPGALINL